MEITDLNGVGPVIAQRLDVAGFGTVASIAAADSGELLAVPGVGPALAARLKADAEGLLNETLAEASRPKREKRGPRKDKVAKSVKSLRKAAPGLAKSKKDAKRLKASADLLTAWVDDLDKRKVRKQFSAEVAKISDQAKKRTSAKKDAKRLRAHAAEIERTASKIG